MVTIQLLQLLLKSDSTSPFVERPIPFQQINRRLLCYVKITTQDRFVYSLASLLHFRWNYSGEYSRQSVLLARGLFLILWIIFYQIKGKTQWTCSTRIWSKIFTYCVVVTETIHIYNSLRGVINRQFKGITGPIFFCYIIIKFEWPCTENY